MAVSSSFRIWRTRLSSDKIFWNQVIFLLQFLIFALQLLPVKALQSFQAHVKDSLGLDIVQAEALAQTLFASS